MLRETLKKRLATDRPVTSITLRIPVDVVDSLKAIAPGQGLQRVSDAAEVLHPGPYLPLRASARNGA